MRASRAGAISSCAESDLETIKLIAIDLDGPLLVDTFSPIMYQLCRDYYRIDYTRALERHTFSRPRAEVVAYIRQLQEPAAKN